MMTTYTKDDSLEERIEGFRAEKITSKKLHDLLEVQGITKKKWLEIKIDNDLDYNALENVNKNNSILVPKQHYARLLAASSIEDSANEVYDYVSYLVKKNSKGSWLDYLPLFSSFCNSSGFRLEIDDELTYTTINLQHGISESFTNIMELVWKKITNDTKEVKLENCIKTDVSIIIKFQKL